GGRRPESHLMNVVTEQRERAGRTTHSHLKESM
ncbi:MAG: hypothetical protein QOJ75_1786, partial [Chloroflexota bacterium]|nr:hypothetical protein [Chloroflexota bacterium]